MKRQKYERVQGKEWHLIKDNFKLLKTYKNSKGNIKGFYSNGNKIITHWMSDEEKKGNN